MIKMAVKKGLTLPGGTKQKVLCREKQVGEKFNTLSPGCSREENQNKELKEMKVAVGLMRKKMGSMLVAVVPVMLALLIFIFTPGFAQGAELKQDVDKKTVQVVLRDYVLKYRSVVDDLRKELEGISDAGQGRGIDDEMDKPKESLKENLGIGFPEQPAVGVDPSKGGLVMSEGEKKEIPITEGKFTLVARHSQEWWEEHGDKVEECYAGGYRLDFEDGFFFCEPELVPICPPSGCVNENNGGSGNENTGNEDNRSGWRKFWDGVVEKAKETVQNILGPSRAGGNEPDPEETGDGGNGGGVGATNENNTSNEEEEEEEEEEVEEEGEEKEKEAEEVEEEEDEEGNTDKDTDCSPYDPNGDLGTGGGDGEGLERKGLEDEFYDKGFHEKEDEQYPRPEYDARQKVIDDNEKLGNIIEEGPTISLQPKETGLTDPPKTIDLHQNTSQTRASGLKDNAPSLTAPAVEERKNQPLSDVNLKLQ